MHHFTNFLFVEMGRKDRERLILEDYDFDMNSVDGLCNDEGTFCPGTPVFLTLMKLLELL